MVQSKSKQKWQSVGLLAMAQLLAISLWLSLSAAVPQLTQEWQLTGGQQAWMTMSVQIGFAVGALFSAAFNLADRMSLQRLIAVSAVMGAIFNGAIALWVNGPEPAIALRFFTGVTLAGVYPPGMKLISTWCKEDRGLGIGILIGAMTVGTALPHFVKCCTVGRHSTGIHGMATASAGILFLCYSIRTDYPLAGRIGTIFHGSLPISLALRWKGHDIWTDPTRQLRLPGSYVGALCHVDLDANVTHRQLRKWRLEYWRSSCRGFQRNRCGSDRVRPCRFYG